MKIIPFQKPDSDYRVDLREGIALDRIPYTWCSNLSDEQLRDIYNRLLRDRFFVRKPDIELKKLTSAVVISWNPAVTQFQYEDGLCEVQVFHDKVWVIYRTYEQWEAWTKAKEKEEKAERRAGEQKQALRNKHSELQEKGESLINSGHLEEAEKCLLECHRLFLGHPNVLWSSGAKFLLMKLYGLYGDPRHGLAFLSEHDSSDYDYYLLAEHFTANPHKAEAIFKEGIKRFPDEGFLYKRLCLYLEGQQLFDKAIDYCEEGIAKGLTDGTKTGFPGRLQRLKKHKVGFTETETNT